MTNPTRQLGFIALISVLMISVVLLVTTLGLAQFGLANRFFIMNLEQKMSSKKLAEACAHIARILIFNDPNRTLASPLLIKIETETCTIHSITSEGGLSHAKTRAQSGDATTNLCVTIDGANGDFTGWRELSTSESACP